MVTPRYEVVGTGPTCLVLAPAGIDWYLRTLPVSLFAHLAIVLIEPTITQDPAGATIQNAVRDLEAVRTELAADQAVVLGHSSNGLIALTYASEYPEATAGVVAVGTPPSSSVDRSVLQQYWERHAEDERRSRFVEFLEAGDAEEDDSRAQDRLYRRADALRRWYDISFDPSPLDDINKVDRRWVKNVLLDDAGARDWSATMAAVRAPVLLILGEADFVVPPPSWDGVDGPRQLTRQVLPRSGHQPFFDQPDLFVAVLREWLERHALHKTVRPPE